MKSTAHPNQDKSVRLKIPRELCDALASDAEKMQQPAAQVVLARVNDSVDAAP